MKSLPKTWSVIVAFAIIHAVDPNSSQVQAGNWPVVRSLRETRTFTNVGKDNVDTPLRALIKDSAGVSVYSVICHSGNYEGRGEINFSGDFQCALFAVKGEARTSGNLLAVDAKDERSADWWNRGRMRSAQLRGEWLAYPEYSTMRHFKLRGMRFTMRYWDIEWSASKDQQGNPRLGQFAFSLDVSPDRTAHTNAAQRAVGPEPPAQCYP